MKKKNYGGNMRNKANKHLGIEVDPELHRKLHYIAKHEGRSANGQILYLIRKIVREFEEKTARSKKRGRMRRGQGGKCVQAPTSGRREKGALRFLIIPRVC